MSLPEEPQSRVEQYLGASIEQASAEAPESPQSRIEEYLAVLLSVLSGQGTVPSVSDNIEIAASDDPEIHFKITVDSEGKITTERII